MTTPPIEGLGLSELFIIAAFKDADDVVKEETLACPHCGSDLLHTDDIWLVKNGKVWNVDLRGQGNPAIRPVRVGDKPPISLDDNTGHRYVIALEAWCEECPVSTSWVFTQHKGTTVLQRRASGEWRTA